MMSKSAQYKQRLRIRYKYMLLHREFPAYAQRLYFLEPWDSWNRRRRDNHGTSHLGDTETISINLTWVSRRLFELARLLHVYFFYTRPTVRRWDNQIGVIRELYH